MKNIKHRIDESNFINSNKIFTVSGSFFAAVMLFIDMEMPSFESVSSTKIINYIAECLKNLSISFDDVFFQISIVFFAFVILSEKIASLNIERLRFSRLFSLFLAVMWTFSKSFSMTNDLHMLIASPGQVIKSIMFGLGSYYIAQNSLHVFYCFLEKKSDFVPRDIKMKNGKSIAVKKLFDLWDRHSFAFPFVFLLIAWGPYTLLSYPGNLCSDAYIVLCQFFGILEFTTHHPPLYTLILGYFVSFGKTVFNSVNVGVFIYDLFQYVVCAASMAYTLCAMSKMNSPYWLKVLSICIYGFMPHFASYVTIATKDVLFCMMLAVFMTQIILMFVQKKEFWIFKNVIITGLSMMLVMLLRNNGKHVLLPLAVLLIIKFIIDYKKRIYRLNILRQELLC